MNRMGSDRPGWVHAARAAVWVACLGLLACHPALTISGPAPDAPPVSLAPGDVICVVQPEDRRSGDVVYGGSGAAIANRIARLLADQQAKVVRVESARRSTGACPGSKGKYEVVAVILDGERHSGFFVNRARVKLHLSLMRPQGEKPLRSVDFAMQDAKPNVFLFSPPVLPPEQFNEAVRRLLPP